MRKIDIHTHILPPQLPDFKEKFGYGGFVVLKNRPDGKTDMLKDDGKFFRTVEPNCLDIEARLHEMDAKSVDVQVISTVPVMFSYWAKPEHCYEISRFLNDHIAQEVAKHPSRFIGLATLPMQDSKLAIKELERAVKELGLAGVQIGTHVNQKNLDSAELFPILEAAAELSACVFVHPWDMMAPERMSKYWLSWLVGMPAETTLSICSMIFGGVFEKLPKLRVAFAHGGGSFMGTLGRIEHGFNVRPDLCAIDNKRGPREYLGRFWVDSLVHDPLLLPQLIQTFGEDKVALGTDYPFPLGEELPGELIMASGHLSKDCKNALLYKNALSWLGETASTGCLHCRGISYSEVR